MGKFPRNKRKNPRDTHLEGSEPETTKQDDYDSGNMTGKDHIVPYNPTRRDQEFREEIGRYVQNHHYGGLVTRKSLPE